MSDTVFVTKYALTRGVFQTRVIKRDDDGYTKVEWKSGLNGTEIFRNEFIADTFEEAMIQVHKMHDMKLESLNRAIKKLNDTFPQFFFLPKE